MTSGSQYCMLVQVLDNCICLPVKTRCFPLKIFFCRLLDHLCKLQNANSQHHTQHEINSFHLIPIPNSMAFGFHVYIVNCSSGMTRQFNIVLWSYLHFTIPRKYKLNAEQLSNLTYLERQNLFAIQHSCEICFLFIFYFLYTVYVPFYL